MTAPPPLLRVAVVGHTNTGKTSLMRTLMRDVEFGEVSDRPAVTRVVTAAVLHAAGEPVLELFDTPGLEDSIGLLDELDTRRGARRLDGLDVLREFLASPAASGRFAQEAKALRQVLESDLALYVVDARDRVLAKHRDELEILGRTATPIVPVLNFVASPEAKVEPWREHMARVNMHAVAEFDTVVFAERDEERLFEKMRSLADRAGATIDRLLDDRRQQRAALVRGSALLVAELLADVAAHVMTVSADPAAAEARTKAMDELRQNVRDREQRCVDELLALHRFRPGDVDSDRIPLRDGAWGLDLFSPETLKRMGLRAGGGAATGAMVGLTADALLGGLSLGAGAAAGAAIGGLWGTLSGQSRRLIDRARGFTELRVDEPTIRIIGMRQMALVRALLVRGHASMTAVALKGVDEIELPSEFTALVRRARTHPEWSALGKSFTGSTDAASARDAWVETMTYALQRDVWGG